MNDTNIWYFAYGSNLNMGQMMTRIGEWLACKRAVAKGYRLAFNVQSKRWGGLAANVVRTNNLDDIVHGVIYRIPREKLAVLTMYEGVEPTDIEIEADGVRMKAKAYAFTTSMEPGRPPDTYLEVMLTGLRQHSYSEDVTQRVEKLAEYHQRD
jgi:cation transport regulator ChaC